MPLLHDKRADARTPVHNYTAADKGTSSREQHVKDRERRLWYMPVKAEWQPQDRILGAVQHEEDDGCGNLVVGVPADVRSQELGERLRPVPEPG